jgi:hypothetical protein
MMQAGHAHADSLHRLVMDLHKRLNALQVDLAGETHDGVATYSLAEADRPLVAAFMAGLSRLPRAGSDCQSNLYRCLPGTSAVLPGGAEAARRDLGAAAHRGAVRRRAVLPGDRSLTATDTEGCPLYLSFSDLAWCS